MDYICHLALTISEAENSEVPKSNLHQEREEGKKGKNRRGEGRRGRGKEGNGEEGKAKQRKKQKCSHWLVILANLYFSDLIKPLHTEKSALQMDSKHRNGNTCSLLCSTGKAQFSMTDPHTHHASHCCNPTIEQITKC